MKLSLALFNVLLFAYLAKFAASETENALPALDAKTEQGYVNWFPKLLYAKEGILKNCGYQCLRRKTIASRPMLTPSTNGMQVSGTKNQQRVEESSNWKMFDISRRAWLIDDDVLRELEDDIQSLIDRTSEDDIIFFKTTKTIKPRRSITIRWNLTLATQPDRDVFFKGVISESDFKTTITCPSDGALFISKSGSLTFANIIFSSCAGNGDILVLDPKYETSLKIRQTRFIHTEFRDNTLLSPHRIIKTHAGAYTTLVMENVLFYKNICEDTECVLLPAKSAFKRLKLDSNSVKDSVSSQAFFAGPRKFKTIVSGALAMKNQIRLFNALDGTATITNSVFDSNEYTSDGSIVYAKNSRVSISDSVFQDNSAINGGCVYSLSSEIQITDCSFIRNNANEGAAFFSNQNSVKLDRSVFSENNSKIKGTVYVEGGSMSVKSCRFSQNINTGLVGSKARLSLKNSQFTNNAAENGAACIFDPNTIIKAQGLLFEANTATGYGGAIYSEKDNEIYIQTSQFLNNKANINGGALYIQDNSKLEMLHSKLQGNEAKDGGAIYGQDYSTITMILCTYQSNKASSSGGAIWAEETSMLLASCLFHANEAKDGGACYISEKGDTQITNSTFTRNSAKDDGGAISIEDESTLKLSHTTFKGNEATEDGGALYVTVKAILEAISCTFHGNKAKLGGGMSIVHYSSALLDSCQFIFGEARYGGAIFIHDYSAIEIKNSIFRRNLATDYGGAIWIGVKSTLKLSHTTFKGNEAIEDGGALYVTVTTILEATSCTFYANKAISDGGGAYINDKSNALVDSCQFIFGKAGFGGAIYMRVSAVEIKNSIFKRNSAIHYGGAIRQSSKVYLKVSDSILQGSCIPHITKAISMFIVVSRLTVQFVGNTANYGGAIRSYGDYPMNIINTRFVLNSASECGGAIYFNYSPKLKTFTPIFESNTAPNGDDCYCYKGSTHDQCPTISIMAY